MSDLHPDLAALSRVRIILCEPTHPGNIGATARAMKTMGLSRLALVNPAQFPSAQATAMASGADDLLTNATVHPDLADALAGCAFIVGASARLRHVEVPFRDPREAASRLAREAGSMEVAVVFGRERSGLTNAELGLCHELVHIPSNPQFSSLNLAQAVQVLAYELRFAMLAGGAAASARTLATAEHVESFFEHLEAVLWKVDFLVPGQTERMLLRLRRLFLRAELDHTEVNILRGVLSAVEKKIQRLKA